MSNQKKFNYMPIAMNKENSDSGHSSRTSSIGNDATRNIPNSYSSQALMNNIDSDSVITTGTNPVRGNTTTLTSSSNSKQWFTVGVLCFVNLINYMDRFTIAGVLSDIQEEFKKGDDWGGLLQTVFVLSYMIFAPLFGYLGDRHSRRIIMLIGVFLWSTTTLLGSFMYNQSWFMTFRAFVGIGEASYSTIAPTIISDLFIHDMRSKMLALFYFAIPVGSGMGYIVGSETAKAAGTWRWALRVTPILGAIAVLLLFLIEEPERGSSEGATSHTSTSSYLDDIKYLIKNRSFMLTTCGFTCVAFVTGALAWFGPKFIHLGLLTQTENKDVTINDVSFKFGAITMVAGILGVPLGSYFSTVLVKRYPTVDPLICAFGLLISVPLLAAAMILVSKSAIAAYILVFVGELFLNMNWAVVCDMTLYVVVPTRRSTAEAFQILISHAFGDAGSPYLVGVISEAIKKYLRKSVADAPETLSAGLKSLALTVGQVNSTISATTTTALSTTIGSKSSEMPDDSFIIQFQALQYALFSTSFIEVIGGIFFLITAVYIVRDKLRAAQETRENEVNANSNDISTEASEEES
ncbi:protein spinster [Condylostylus longicornis]|uniref:protein spinster n=1 Tax=Condylostylus longicornis TaxID=2530218 RepID=UPI00244DD56B|nr:protein spinster [Condylostylus longicornis]